MRNCVCLHTSLHDCALRGGLECNTVTAITRACAGEKERFERHLAHVHYVRWDERNAISTPSYTAHPMAELKILRDMRSVEPSRKPATPRCCHVEYACQFYFNRGFKSDVAHLPHGSDGA